MRHKLWLAACAMALMASPAMGDDDCRRYRDEIRVGGGMQDTYVTKCRQQDGRYETKHDPYEKGGYFIRPQDSRHYEPNVGRGTYSGQNDWNGNAGSGAHTHYFNDGYNTRVVIGGGSGPMVVVDPFDSWRYGNRHYRGYYQRDWSPAKRSFHQHHRGPGWQKHWQHHQRSMNGGKK